MGNRLKVLQKKVFTLQNMKKTYFFDSQQCISSLLATLSPQKQSTGHNALLKMVKKIYTQCLYSNLF